MWLLWNAYNIPYFWLHHSTVWLLCNARSGRYCVLVRALDTTDLQWNNYLAPFSLMLWIAMMCTVLVIAFHLTLLCYLGQRYGNQEAEEIQFLTFSDSLLLVLGIFCQQGTIS